MRSASEINEMLNILHNLYAKLNDYFILECLGKPLPADAAKIIGNASIGDRMSRISGEIYGLEWALNKASKV